MYEHRTLIPRLTKTILAALAPVVLACGGGGGDDADGGTDPQNDGGGGTTVDSGTPDAAVCHLGAWSVEKIDDGYGDTRQHSAMVIDDAGTIYALYDAQAQVGVPQVTLAFKTVGGDWTIEPVDYTDEFNGGRVAIGVTAERTVHVAHANSGVLWHASRESNGTWSELVSAAPDDAPSEPALLAAASGVYLAYMTGSGMNRAVKVLTRDGASWTPATVTTGASFNRLTMAEGSDGDLHLTAYKISQSDLFYARRTGTTWSSELPDTTDAVGGWPSPVIDGDTVHIAYADFTNDVIKHASKTGAGDWTTATIASVTNGESAMAMTPDGTLHAIYPDAGEQRYATRAVGGDWAAQDSVDASGVGRELVLRVAPDGSLHAVYYDGSSDEIRHAERPCQ